VVHTLPAVWLIFEANPHAEITWVINPEWVPILRGRVMFPVDQYTAA